MKYSIVGETLIVVVFTREIRFMIFLKRSMLNERQDEKKRIEKI